MASYAYVTDRLIAMSMPIAGESGEHVAPTAAAAAAAAPSGQLAPQLPGAGGNSVVLPRPSFDAVRAALLAAHGASHVVVVNASEQPYAYGELGGAVLELGARGHPALPLAQLCHACVVLDTWLAAAPRNVAAVHCRTGRGRTNAILACYLVWCGRVKNTAEALLLLSRRRGLPLPALFLPSQRRFVGYFDALLRRGAPPQPMPLVLRRIVVGALPAFTRVLNDSATGYSAGLRPVVIVRRFALPFLTPAAILALSPHPQSLDLDTGVLPCLLLTRSFALLVPVGLLCGAAVAYPLSMSTVSARNASGHGACFPRVGAQGGTRALQFRMGHDVRKLGTRGSGYGVGWRQRRRRGWWQRRRRQPAALCSDERHAGVGRRAGGRDL